MKMEIEITAFGIAKDILKQKRLSMSLGDKPNIAELRTSLIDQFPDFEKLSSLKFAVNTEYVTEDYLLNEKDEVVLIPPVSGG